MRTREGYREWAINCETAPGLGFGVRSIVPYSGVSGTPSDKLFAMTNEGIWDVTDQSQAPAIVLTFTNQTGRAGFGNYSHYTLANDNDIVMYADEENGLFEYDPAGDSWAQSIDITGIDVLNVVFVVVHKQRVWFVERNTANAWYLPIGSISGLAVKFIFGSKFRHGGDLVALYNWTIDGGDGIDDYLVAVGRGGDVLPYRGEDPSSAATWSGVGTFYIGEIAKGRRCAAEDGGDLHILSNFGLTSLDDLLKGSAFNSDAEAINLKIARFLRLDMGQLAQDDGWEIRHDTNEGVILINTPRRTNGEYIQYSYNIAVQGWGQWRGVPGITFEPWEGTMMVGTEDNRVLRMDVTVDESTFANPAGRHIEFSMLQNYLDAGAPAIFKYGKFIRPNFLAERAISLSTRFLYDYDIALNLPPPPTILPVEDPLWDTAAWDSAIWGFGGLKLQSVTFGSLGKGRVLTVAMRGEAIARTTLVSTDVMWTPAGPF